MSSIEITVIDREGVATPGIEWDDDESLMECLVRNKYPILASCGGNASCSTCHSYLDPESYEQAGEIDEDEADVLDSLMDRSEERRVGKECDGRGVARGERNRRVTKDRSG